MGKHELLRRKQLISLLFSSGNSEKGDFIRVVYASLKPDNHVFQGVPAILFTVGKKTLSSSVSRNRVKRMMREAYRLEKTLLTVEAEEKNDGRLSEQLCIAFIYIGRRKTLPALEAFSKEISGLMGRMELS